MGFFEVFSAVFDIHFMEHYWTFKCTTYVGYQVFVTVQLCHGRVSIFPVYTAVSTFFSGTPVLAFFPVRPCHGFFLYVRVTFFSCTAVSQVCTHIQPLGFIKIEFRNFFFLNSKVHVSLLASYYQIYMQCFARGHRERVSAFRRNF